MLDAQRTTRSIALAATVLWTALASAAPPSVTAAWARATAPGVDTAAAYLTLVNGATTDRLVALQSASARVVEIHETVEQGGVATMRRVDPVTLAPNERLELRPGGKHLMLFGLAKPLVPATTIAVTLRFERAGVVEAQIPVLDARAAAPAVPPAHGSH